MPNSINHKTFMCIAQVIRFYFIVIAHVIHKEQRKAVSTEVECLAMN